MKLRLGNLLRKRANRMQFVETTQNGNLSSFHSPKPETKDSLSSMLYQDCHALTLDRFIDCLCDGDLQRLVREGNPDIASLADHWQKIFYEYIDHCGKDEYNAILSLTKEINTLNGRIVLLEGFISIQQAAFEANMGLWQDGVDVLRKQGLRPKFADDGSNWQSEMDSLRQRNKLLIVELDQAQKKLSEIQSANQDKPGITKAYFDDQLMVLSEIRGYAVRAQDISVYQFVQMIKRASKDAEKQK